MRTKAVETRELPCKLTDDELTTMARTLGYALRRQGEIEIRHEEEKARIKTETAAIESEVSRVSAIVRDGAEPRPVKVEIILDDDVGEVLEVRQDTGEVISTRKMLDAERQLDLASQRLELSDIAQRALKTFRALGVDVSINAEPV